MNDGLQRGPAAGHIAGLDGIRAVAALLVFLFHARVPGFGAGFLGVDVFFVLSGYLISALLLAEIDRTGTVDLAGFWWRRMLRLYPALLLVAGGFVLAAPLFPVMPDAPLRQALLALLYVSDYARAFGTLPDELSHTWSLAAEAKFYLLWPLFLVAMARALSPQLLLRAILLVFLAATMWRVVCFQAGQGWDAVYYRFDTRVSGLLAGAVLAAALRAGMVVRLPRLCGSLALALVPLVLVPLAARRFGDGASLVWGQSLVEVASLLLIVAVLDRRGRVGRLLAAAPMAWLGKLSYGFYLWHYPVVRALRDHVEWPGVVAVGLALSLALAWASLLAVERPLMRLRGRPALARPPVG